MIQAILLQPLELILEPKHKSGKLFASIQPPEHRRTWKPRISMMDEKKIGLQSVTELGRLLFQGGAGWWHSDWFVNSFWSESIFWPFVFHLWKSFWKTEIGHELWHDHRMEQIVMPVPVWNYFKITESSAPVLRKQSESWRTASLLYFNNLRTLAVSMKEPRMNWWFYGRLFNSFPNNFRNMVICQNQSLWFYENCDYESYEPSW